MRPAALPFANASHGEINLNSLSTYTLESLVGSLALICFKIAVQHTRKKVRSNR